MSVCDPGPSDSGAHLGRFLSRLPFPLVENVEETEQGVTVLARFSLVSYALIGGRGDGATVNEARSKAHRLLASRLCQLHILTDTIVDLVEKHGEEAIALFLPDTCELFEHVDELITQRKKVSVKARISKSWDAALFPADRHLLSQALTTSIGSFWQEQWREIRLPGHCKRLEEDSRAKPEPPNPVYDNVGLKSEPVECSQESCVSLPLSTTTLEDVGGSAEAGPSAAMDAHRKRPASTLVASLKRVKVEVEEQQVKRAVKADTLAVATREVCEETPTVREKEREEVRQMRETAAELATIFGTTLEEDAECVRLAGVDLAFLSAPKADPNPYKTLIKQATKWNLLPQIPDSETATFAGCLWKLLAPLVSKYGDGASASAKWKKLEIVDIGARFWQRPVEMRIVKLPLPTCDDEMECMCRVFIEGLTRKTVLTLVKEESKGQCRVHFLQFPVQLFGTTEFVEESRLYSTFVRSLCECGMLPPWVECVYLFIGMEKEMAVHWSVSLTQTFASAIAPSLRADYLSKDSALHICDAEDSSQVLAQRKMIRAYMQKLWKKAVVTVPEEASSQFALSFRVRKKNGEAVWPKDAQSVGESKVDRVIANGDCGEPMKVCLSPTTLTDPPLPTSPISDSPLPSHPSSPSPSSSGDSTPEHCELFAQPPLASSAPFPSIPSLLHLAQPPPALVPAWIGSTPPPLFVPPPPIPHTFHCPPPSNAPPPAAPSPPPRMFQPLTLPAGPSLLGINSFLSAPPGFPAGREGIYLRCAESICKILGWTLEVLRTSDGEVLYFSGLHWNIAYGRANKRRGRCEALICRVRELRIIPPTQHGKPLDPVCKEAAMLRCLMEILRETLEANSSNVTSLASEVMRIGRGFWAMATPAVKLLPVLEIPQRDPPTDDRDRHRLLSALSEWLLPRIAQRAGTRLMLANNEVDASMMWFRSVSHIRLGVVAPCDRSPYAAFLALLCERGIVNQPLSSLPGTQASWDVVVGCAAERVRSASDKETANNQRQWNREKTTL